MADINHLLILTPGFPESEEDTTCLPAVQQFVKCYQQLFPSCRITILSLHYPFYKQSYKWNNIQVHSLRGQNKNGIARGMTLVKAILQALKINRGDKIDAILSLWLTDAALAGKYIAQIMHVPHLIWLHGQDARKANKYVRYVNPNAAQLAVMSEHHSKILKEAHGIEAKYIIYNGINKDIFPELNIKERSIDLFAAGSFIPLKRYDLFIKLVKEIKDAGYPEIKAGIAGDGILENELKAMAVEYGLSNNIHFTGRISHDDVLNFMNNSKIFVHTSEYESLSTVMIEALYSGNKVVGFVPLTNAYAKDFVLCENLEQMKKACIDFLINPTKTERYLTADMHQSARQVHDILTNTFLNYIVSN